MPRFLDTRTGDFVWVEDPSSIIYAILSHTWRSKEEGSEQSYTQVEKLRKRIQKAHGSASSDADSILSHPELSDKIKGICEVALKAGYEYVWIDSCCIDKTSSAELAEAINSMFDLYRLATVCYVFLSDVPDGTAAQDKGSKFAKSRWHTRGWTLQELIAPDRVVFLSSQWTFLGTKIGLAATLQNITGIAFTLLTGGASLDSFSVARRMSWAARRETTRVEDEAYSLLGIFGIHMSPIYGEGRNAFLRLQEEIVKNIPDQSIFAWGSSIALVLFAGVFEDRRKNRSSMEPTGLLAPFPNAFSHTGNVEPLSPGDFLSCLTGNTRHERDGRPDLAVPSLHCMFTPQGVRLDVLSINLAEVPEISDFAIQRPRVRFLDKDEGDSDDEVSGGTVNDCCLQRGRTRSLAVLRCKDSAGRLMALPLFSPSSSSGEQRGISVATHTRCSVLCRGNPSFRLIGLTESALAAIRDRHLLSRESTPVSFLRSSSSVVDSSGRSAQLMYINLGGFVHDVLGPQPYIRFAPMCEEVLRTAGFTSSPPAVVRPIFYGDYDTVVVKTMLASLLSKAPQSCSRARARQHIQIELVMRRVQERNTTELKFSVKNIFHIPPPDQCASVENDADSGNSDDRGNSDRLPTDRSELLASDICTFCLAPHCTILNVPSADDSDGSRTMFVLNDVKSNTVIARTQFHVYAEWDLRYPPTERPHQASIRLLRLTLEHPWKAFDGPDPDPDFRYLWLSVELSEAFLPAPH